MRLPWNSSTASIAGTWHAPRPPASAIVTMSVNWEFITVEYNIQKEISTKKPWNNLVQWAITWFNYFVQGFQNQETERMIQTHVKWVLSGGRTAMKCVFDEANLGCHYLEVHHNHFRQAKHPWFLHCRISSNKKKLFWLHSKDEFTG